MNAQSFLLLAVSSACLFGAVVLGLLRIGPIWDGLVFRQIGSLTTRYELLYSRSPLLAILLRAWGLAIALAFVVLWLVMGMFPLAVVAVTAIYIAPRYILAALIRRREKLLRDQMVPAARGLANAVKAGLSLAQALECICDEVSEPLVSELRRIVYEYQRGRPLVDAIDEVRRRLDLEAFSLFALAIQVSLERGGRINDVLERIGASLQENQRLERKLEAETSSGNQVVLILAAFPVIFLLFFYFLDPHSGGLLFHTLIGQFVLAAVSLLVFGGVRWANSIMRIE
ncbi:MAG TPA: type II secretion system F family protein [Planctomycetaceae bacterium]|jgi:tight adherence protein B|nr:type II secretion system F family protein [Planctomycetaceae bacterium]